VEVRPVTLGPATGGEASIETGLAAGEQVVVDGVDKLRPGSTVQARPADDRGGASKNAARQPDVEARSDQPQGGSRN
jgi:hypothetical protein